MVALRFSLVKLSSRSLPFHCVFQRFLKVTEIIFCFKSFNSGRVLKQNTVPLYLYRHAVAQLTEADAGFGSRWDI
jgi:hypothetical protein